MKKKYNPFKMWGAWVGAVIPAIIFLYVLVDCKFITQSTDCGMGVGILSVWTLIAIPVGFLIGWAIHSLVRRVK